MAVPTVHSVHLEKRDMYLHLSVLPRETSCTASFEGIRFSISHQELKELKDAITRVLDLIEVHAVQESL